MIDIIIYVFIFNILYFHRFDCTKNTLNAMLSSYFLKLNVQHTRKLGM